MDVSKKKALRVFVCFKFHLIKSSLKFVLWLPITLGSPSLPLSILWLPFPCFIWLVFPLSSSLSSFPLPSLSSLPSFLLFYSPLFASFLPFGQPSFLLFAALFLAFRKPLLSLSLSLSVVLSPLSFLLFHRWFLPLFESLVCSFMS